MKILQRALKNRPSRAAGGASLGASQSMPNSGFAFVDNSQGASAAIVELSNAVGFAHDDLDVEGDLTSQSALRLEQLEEKASQFENSRLLHAQPQETLLTKDDVDLVSLVWKAASAVYKHSEVHDVALQAQGLDLFHYSDRSVGGTIKSAAFFRACNMRPAANDALFKGSTLVVAIRGSKHKIPDHMVNANYEARSLNGILENSPTRVENVSSLKVHAGFANVAEAMMAAVMETISSSDATNVLFTGHSAGGAVASLLYLRSLSQDSEKSLFQPSLITFGSPPVITEPIALPQSTARTKAWNFINEFDVIARVDASYILALADMFRSIYNKPPLSDQETSICHSQGCWPLPPPDYFHIGDRIVLREAQDSDNLNETAKLQDTSKTYVQSFILDQHAFSQLLFCNTRVHHKPEYAKRLEQLIRSRTSCSTSLIT